MKRMPKNKQILPDLPPEAWCDFRREYEKTRSLIRVAERFYCDPRTVRRCLQLNKSSTDLGCQTAPRILDRYTEEIHRLYHALCAEVAVAGDGFPGSCRLSRQITEHLVSLGYTGSERTVRNYIRQHCLAPVRKEKHHDPD